jgi:hypothetical protein
LFDSRISIRSSRIAKANARQNQERARRPCKLTVSPPVMSQLAAKRNLAGRAYADRLSGGRRQIDMPTRHKWSAIIDAHDDAAVMTNLHSRAERQCAMCSSQSAAIHPLAIRGATAAKSIRSAIYTCHFSPCEITQTEARNYQSRRQHTVPAPIVSQEHLSSPVIYFRSHYESLWTEIDKNMKGWS